MKSHRAVLDVQVLGTFVVAVDGQPIGRHDWKRVSAERLFKFLVISPGHRARREDAAEALWPEMDPQHQDTNLRKALHFARRAVDRGVRVLVADGAQLGFARDIELRCDLDMWFATVDRLRHGDSREALDLQSDPIVGTVLRLGAESVLPADPHEDWLTRVRERVEIRWRALAIDVAEREIARERYGVAEELLEAVLVRDPADEDAHRLLVTAYASQGHVAAARRQYLICRRELAGEYRVEPAPETEAALHGLGHASPTEPGSAETEEDSTDPR